jgi:hypothetical protein
VSVVHACVWHLLVVHACVCCTRFAGTRKAGEPLDLSCIEKRLRMFLLRTVALNALDCVWHVSVVHACVWHVWVVHACVCHVSVVHACVCCTQFAGTRKAGGSLFIYLALKNVADFLLRTVTLYALDCVDLLTPKSA